MATPQGHSECPLQLSFQLHAHVLLSGDAQTQLALAQDKERSANERVLEVDVKLSTLESQVSTLRQEKSRLQAALEMEKAKVEILEDAKNK